MSLNDSQYQNLNSINLQPADHLNFKSHQFYDRVDIQSNAFNQLNMGSLQHAQARWDNFERDNHQMYQEQFNGANQKKKQAGSTKALNRLKKNYIDNVQLSHEFQTQSQIQDKLFIHQHQYFINNLFTQSSGSPTHNQLQTLTQMTKSNPIFSNEFQDGFQEDQNDFNSGLNNRKEQKRSQLRYQQMQFEEFNSSGIRRVDRTEQNSKFLLAGESASQSTEEQQFAKTLRSLQHQQFQQQNLSRRGDQSDERSNELDNDDQSESYYPVELLKVIKGKDSEQSNYNQIKKMRKWSGEDQVSQDGHFNSQISSKPLKNEVMHSQQLKNTMSYTQGPLFQVDGTQQRNVVAINIGQPYMQKKSRNQKLFKPPLGKTQVNTTVQSSQRQTPLLYRTTEEHAMNSKGRLNEGGKISKASISKRTNIQKLLSNQSEEGKSSKLDVIKSKPHKVQSYQHALSQSQKFDQRQLSGYLNTSIEDADKGQSSDNDLSQMTRQYSLKQRDLRVRKSRSNSRASTNQLQFKLQSGAASILKSDQLSGGQSAITQEQKNQMKINALKNRFEQSLDQDQDYNSYDQLRVNVVNNTLVNLRVKKTPLMSTSSKSLNISQLNQRTLQQRPLTSTHSKQGQNSQINQEDQIDLHSQYPLKQRQNYFESQVAQTPSIDKYIMTSSLDQDTQNVEASSIGSAFRMDNNQRQREFYLNQSMAYGGTQNKTFNSNFTNKLKVKTKLGSKIKLGKTFVKNLFQGYKHNKDSKQVLSQTLNQEQFQKLLVPHRENMGRQFNQEDNFEQTKNLLLQDLKTSALRSRNDLIQYYTEGSPIKKRNYEEIMQERLYHKKIAGLILQGDLAPQNMQMQKSSFINVLDSIGTHPQEKENLEDISDFQIESILVQTQLKNKVNDIKITDQNQTKDQQEQQPLEREVVLSIEKIVEEQVVCDQKSIKKAQTGNLHLPLSKSRKSKFVSQRVSSSDQNQIDKTSSRQFLTQKDSDKLIISLQRTQADYLQGDEIKELESLTSSHIEVTSHRKTNQHQLLKSNSVVNKQRRSSLAQHPELNESSIHLLQKESIQNTSQNSPLQNFAINESRDQKKSLEQIVDMRNITAPFPSLIPQGQQPISGSSSGDSGLRSGSHIEETLRGKESSNSNSGDILEHTQTQNNSFNPLDQSRTSLFTLGNIGHSRNQGQQNVQGSGGANQSFNELRSQPRNPSQKSQGKQDHHDFTSILKQYGKMKDKNAIRTKKFQKSKFSSNIPQNLKDQFEELSIKEEEEKFKLVKRGLISKQSKWINDHQKILMHKKTSLMSGDSKAEGQGANGGLVKFTQFKPFIFKDPHLLQGKPLSDRSYTISHSANQLISGKELMIDNFRFKFEDLIEAMPTRKDSDDVLLLKLRNSNPQLFNVKRNSPEKEKGREGINAGKFSIPFQRKVSEPAQGVVSGTTNGTNGPVRRRFSKLETLTPSKEARQRFYNQENNLEKIREFDETGHLGTNGKNDGAGGDLGSPDKFKTQNNLLRLIGRSKTQSKIQLSFGQHSIKQDLDKLQKDEESIRISRILLKNEMKHNQESLRQDRDYNLRFSEVMNDIFKNSRRTDHTFDSLTESSHETSYFEDQDDEISETGSPRIISHVELDKYEEQFHNKITIQNSNKASFFNQSFSTQKVKRPVKQSSGLSGLMLSVATSFMNQSKAQIRLNLFDENYRQVLTELDTEADETDFAYEVKDKRYFIFVRENLVYPEISNSLIQFSTNQQIEVKVLRQLSQGRRGATNKVKAEQLQAAKMISHAQTKTLGENLVRHRSNPNQLTVFTNSLNSTQATQVLQLNHHNTSVQTQGRGLGQNSKNVGGMINTTSLTLNSQSESKHNVKQRSLSILDRALQDLNDGFRLLFPLTEEGEHHFQLIDVMRDEKFTHLFKSTDPQLDENNEERVEILGRNFMRFLQGNIFNQDVEFYNSLFKGSIELKSPPKKVVDYRHTKQTSVEYGKFFQQENFLFFRRNILQEIIRSLFLTEFVSAEKLQKKDAGTLKALYDRLSKILKLSVKSLIHQKGPEHVRNLSLTFQRRNSSPTRTNITSQRNPSSQRSRLKSHIFLSDHLNFICFNQDVNNQSEVDEGDGITIFDQKKYKSGAISSFKLNEVFGYSAKTLSYNLFEVFEPKADARNIIYKGLKKKQLLLGLTSKQNQPYDLRVTNVDEGRAESARAGGRHSHQKSRSGEVEGLVVNSDNKKPRASAISGHSNNTVNTNFYSNFTNSNSNSNSNNTNPNSNVGNSGNKLLIPSNLVKTRRQSTLGVNQTSFKSISISNNATQNTTITPQKANSAANSPTSKTNNQDKNAQNQDKIDEDSMNARRRSSFSTKMKTMYCPTSGSLPSGVEKIRQMFSQNPRHAHIEKLNTITTMNRDISVGLLGENNPAYLLNNGSSSSNSQNPSPQGGKTQVNKVDPAKRRASKAFGFKGVQIGKGQADNGSENSPSSNRSSKSPNKKSNMKLENQYETLRIKKN